jgi:tRNA (mo5U34)-methyltransferase
VVGEFDVVVCGSLLLHLRDPLRALFAIRSVCREHLLSTNQVDLRRSLWRRGSPLARLDGLSDLCQWWLPNPAGHRQMLLAAGFDVERESGVYAVPFGVAHPRPGLGPVELARRAARRLVAGADGVPHHAALSRPAI